MFIVHKEKFLIIFIFLILLTYNIFVLRGENRIENQIIQYNNQNENNIIIKFNYEKNIPQIKKYIFLLKNAYITSDIYNNKNFNPKISFITTVYNKEKYLYSFICSIQNQNLKEYELIIIDDCSSDRSLEIIKNFQKKDVRIKLIRNKKNMGTLYSRYKGAIYSKGKYIIFVDSDDIILKEGLSNSYNYIKKYNLDMIQFSFVMEKNNKTFINRKCYRYAFIIYQPILSYIFYYKHNSGIENNYSLWDKLIKKNIVLKAFKYIGLEYIHKKIIIENDVIVLFALFRVCKSFQYIDHLGYYYFRNNKDSISNTRDDPKKADQIIYSIFNNIEFLYDKTENTNFTKYFCIFKLHQGYFRYRNSIKYISNRTFTKVNKIINKLLESKYISLENKIMIKNISIYIKNYFFNYNQVLK